VLYNFVRHMVLEIQGRDRASITLQEAAEIERSNLFKIIRSR